jgi:two-component system, LytTR family, sensor kinase
MTRSMIDMPPDRSDIAGGAVVAGRAPLRAVWLLILAYWVAFQIIFYAYLVLADARNSLQPAQFVWRFLLFAIRPSELGICAFGAVICFGIYLAVQRLRGLRLRVQFCAGLALMLAGALGFSLSIELVFTMLDPQYLSQDLRAFVAKMVLWVAPFGLWTAISIALAYNMQIRDREARLARMQIQAHEAQVRALRYQVNPHFLYNTLNSISALIIDGRNDDADAMVMRLSTFFRSSLANDPTADVPLAQEIALQRLYLDIELVRFADSLTVEIDVPAALEDVLVPNLILQPLVENALKHGLNDVGKETLLRISARVRDACLELEVADNGPGASSQAGTGVGLANVARRLAARFGSDAGLEAGPQPGGGFRATLRFPLLRGKRR